jgi:transcriptional regulator with XRE-family HTH domain
MPSNPLRRLLKDRSINISELARKADIPPTTIYNVTGGHRSVWGLSVYVFIRLAHALGMTADELARELHKYEEEGEDGED